MRLPLRGTVTAFFVVLLAAPASATISEALSLDDLVGRADHVVLASTVGSRALRDARNRIVTDYTLRVEDVMKGDAAIGSTLTMRSLGGAIGDIGMRIEGEPRLESGRQYVVFLARTSSGALRPVGMSQGVLPVREVSGTTTVMPGGGGLSLVQRVQGGQLVPAPAALLHPQPYRELRARVDHVIEGGRRGTVSP
jgi:hypothetical protein